MDVDRVAWKRQTIASPCQAISYDARDHRQVAPSRIEPIGLSWDGAHAVFTRWPRASPSTSDSARSETNLGDSRRNAATYTAGNQGGFPASQTPAAESPRRRVHMPPRKAFSPLGRCAVGTGEVGFYHVLRAAAGCRSGRAPGQLSSCRRSWASRFSPPMASGIHILRGEPAKPRAETLRIPQDSQTGIFAIDASDVATGEVTHGSLTMAARCAHATPSPDGTEIAFSSARQGHQPNCGERPRQRARAG